MQVGLPKMLSRVLASRDIAGKQPCSGEWKTAYLKPVHGWAARHVNWEWAAYTHHIEIACKVKSWLADGQTEGLKY